MTTDGARAVPNALPTPRGWEWAASGSGLVLRRSALEEPSGPGVVLEAWRECDKCGEPTRTANTGQRTRGRHPTCGAFDTLTPEAEWQTLISICRQLPARVIERKS